MAEFEPPAQRAVAPVTMGLPEGYDPLAEAKRLLRQIRSGALATLVHATGSPFATLVAIATDFDGSPILLTSALSAHTRNLAADPRASLLLAEGGRGDPLAHPRLTVVGRAIRAREPGERNRLRTRFLSRHPKSALYADFGDFSFWRIAIESAHLNGGFGKAAEFQGTAVLTALEGAQTLVAAEQSALVHLNKDHPEALRLYGQRAGAGGGHWRATGVDPEGVDLACGDRTARVTFPRRIEEPDELRAVLVEMAALARS